MRYTLSVLFCCQLFVGTVLAQTLSRGLNSTVILYERVIRLQSAEKIEVEETIDMNIHQSDSEAEDIAVYYNSDRKITKLVCTIKNGFGEVVETYKMKDFKDVLVFDGNFLSDERVKYIKRPAISYPYSYQLSYTMEVSGFSKVGYLKWTPAQAHHYIKLAKLRIEGDPSTYDTKLFNFPTFAFSENGNSRQWEVSNFQLKNDGNRSFSWSKMPSLAISLKNFDIGKIKGTYNTWHDFGLLMNALWEGRQDLPAEKVAEVKAMIAGKTSETEIVALLYKHMQQKCRYVSIQLGVGGWQTAKASSVDSFHFGDCKALTNYMAALLRVADIEAYPVLVEAGRNAPLKLDTNFVYHRFNHVILYVPSTQQWLECTSESDNAGYLGSFTSNRTGMLFNAAGGKLVNTIVVPDSSNAYNTKLYYTIGTDRTASITGTIGLKGAFFDKNEDFVNNKKKELSERWQEKMQPGLLSNFQFDSRVEREKNLVEFTFTAVLTNHLRKAGKDMIFNAIPSTCHDMPAFENDTTEGDIIINQGFSTLDSIIIQMPGRLSIEHTQL